MRRIISLLTAISLAIDMLVTTAMVAYASNERYVGK